MQIDALLCDVLGEKRDRQTAERRRWGVLEQRPVSTCTPGGKMSLLMDPSFLQHLEQPRPAKGIKYGIIIIIIIMLQLSIILSLSYFHCLSNTDTHTWVYTPGFSLEALQDRMKHMKARVWARAQNYTAGIHTHTHRKIPSSTHTDTVSRLLTRYTMTGGYAPCRLAFADPSFMRLMERDVPFFSFQSDSAGW